MGEWQPIETYAKVSDKTKPILVFIPGWGVTEAKSEFTGFNVFHTRGRTFASGLPADAMEIDHRAPTHWMPLPEPPEPQS